METEQKELFRQFEALIAREDKLLIRDFLNHQNISDVAEMIYEFPDYEAQIVAHLSLHRATSTFKILDFPTQKRIIQSLPAFTSAELLNELPS